MRKGRFAGVNDKGCEAVRAIALGELLTFDFRPAVDEEDQRAAAERAQALQLALPLLAGSDLLWGGVLVGALAKAGATAQMLPIAALVVAALLLDGALAFLFRKPPRPFMTMRLAFGHGLAKSLLWLAAAKLAMSGAGADSVLVKAALVAGAAGAIPALALVPLLIFACCAMTIAVVSVLKTDEPMVWIGTALTVFLFCASLSRSRHMIASARGRLAAEWQAKKARRFVADFEASGRGWFWETNADGALTYVSEPLAAHLGLTAADLLGRRFEEVLLLKEEGEGARTLGFHLSARFPFADVVVRAPASDDSWWSLCGSPNFDDYGRFLGFRGLGTNLSEQRRSEAETTKLARYDSLTGLPNRAMMRATLDEALANAAERKRGCALMLIDLDKFKQVNDTLGHPVGDKLLKKVATRLVEVLGDDGQPGRLGGDEFDAILPGIEEEGRLSELALALIEHVSKPYSIEGHEIRIGASVGIAVARPGKALAEGLIRDADLALYAAKAGGRGTFRFFAEKMHEQATERQILEAELRDALAKDQLRLLYQPIVDSVSEEVVAFEALLRWQHPTRGLLSPAFIIPLAEESGMMTRIGTWVLRTACREAAKWPDHLRVAVNLSPVEFADAALPAAVASALAASALDPDRLELEINEAVFLADGEASERTLNRLRGLGVRLALDNFGTGHSGLGHLRNAPFDKIKIDQSFVRGAGEPRSRNGAIVRAIAVLAESLGMDTTAEGAETLDELTLIRRLGCSQVQGFIFGKPMSAEEALALATESRPSANVVGFTRPPRHRLIRNGRLGWEGADLPVRLRNISAGGAMVECKRPIPTGSPVELDLDEAGRLPAEVRWCQEGQVGIRFSAEFELRNLVRSRPGAALKMMRPQYLDRQPEAPPPPADSPLVAKKRRAR